MTPLTSGLHEECGVFGVFAKEKTNVAATTYYGLFALQHRGQESCGITELEAINILNGFHIDTYCIKYLRKAREAAEGTPEPTKKRRRR